MPRAHYWGSHRTFFTVTIAVAIAIVCVFAIAVVMPSGKPRQVNIIDAAAINPLPTTIGFAAVSYTHLTLPTIYSV